MLYLVLNQDVQRPLVALAAFASDDPLHNVALLHIQGLPQVKESLLPVRRCRLWRGAEHNWILASRLEQDIKVRHQTLQ